jgi:hypothetical protein
VRNVVSRALIADSLVFLGSYVHTDAIRVVDVIEGPRGVPGLPQPSGEEIKFV